MKTRALFLGLLASLVFAASTASAANLASDPLTPAQLNNLRTAVCGNATAAPLMQAGNVAGLESWLNTTTATKGWLTAVTAQVADEAPNYTSYDTLAQGKRDSWARFLAADTRSFAKNKVRAWVTDVWGTATAGSNAEAVLLAGTEAATNAQVLLGGTVKTTGTVTATDRVYDGIVTTPEVTRLVFKDNGQIYTCP